MTSGEFRFVSQVIYDLKRMFPASIRLKRVSGHQVDLTTGLTQLNIDELPIRRAIVLPEKSYEILQRLGIQPGEVPVAGIIVLVDARDLPQNYVIDKEEKVMFRDKEWDIMDIEDNYGIFKLTIKEVEGSPVT